MPLFPDQPIESGEPVFKAPWEAQAFSLVIALHESGVFSWGEWSEALAKAIRGGLHHNSVNGVGYGMGGRKSDEEDIGESYYQHWLAALENLAINKGLSEASELEQRMQAWRETYLRTPHGQPVELVNG